MPEPQRPESQRIAKLLARAGIASRREIERMIEERRIAIDGVAVETPATLLASLDGVTVDGKPVAAPVAARLFLYHKPPGLLVTERDPRARPTIYDRLPKNMPRVVPVGRLDLATEGLLLLTTDGGLKRQLELPATGVERAYRARAYGQVTQARLEELIQGVEIGGVRYGPIDANLERRTGANVWIELVLTEGKNREVRRVLEHLGLQVSRLIRTRYGPFVLGDLPPGALDEVRTQDVSAFRNNPTRADLARPTRSRVPVEARPAPPRPKASPAAAAGPQRPARAGKRRVEGSSETIAKPARAARARAHRAATGRDLAPSAKPHDPGRSARGPGGGRGKPGPGGSRPPRRRT